MIHYFDLLTQTMKRDWDKKAVCNWHGEEFTFKDLAVTIEKLHVFFEKAGIKKAQKVALCAPNSARWAVSSWDKVDYLYKAKNEGDVAYAIQLLSQMFSYHRYIGKVNKHTLMKYLYYGDNNGPGQIVYYTTSDPETHVLYAIFDHDKDKVFTKKDNENILGCIITRHK